MYYVTVCGVGVGYVAMCNAGDSNAELVMYYVTVCDVSELVSVTYGTLEPDACSAGDSNADCLTFFNRDV